MSRMNPEPAPPDVFRLLEKHRRVLLAGTLLSTALAFAAGQFLPKKYKSSFVLTVHSRYFENPLIRDFLAPVHDSTEMRSQREALIRQALDAEFLDELGRRHGLTSAGGAAAPPGALRRLVRRLKPGRGDAAAARLSRERELLLRRIDVQRVNPDTFRISFVHSEPGVTFAAAQDVYLQVLRTLVASRRDILVHARDAIETRMRSLGGGSAPAPAAGAAVQRWRLSEPLEDWSTALARGAGAGWGQEQTAAEMGLYKDLLVKLNYLQVALDSDKAFQGAYIAVLEKPLYPAGPIWPKRGLFLVWGMAAGFIGAGLLCCLREYEERGTLDAATLSRRTGIPLLGSLPALPER